MTTKLLLGILLAVWAFAGEGASADVTLGTLLDEMTDEEAVTRLPAPAYTLRSWSSRDRKSVSPEADGWFANEDWNGFLRTEGRERVMVDARGPGALVRLWCAGHANSNGTLRVYLDGAAEPSFAGSLYDLVGGTALCGEPLSYLCSTNCANPVQRGRNLMLPIPYAQACKVTFEPKEPKCLFWYNAETRAYDASVRVRTLTAEELSAEAGRVAAAGARLQDGRRSAPLGERLSLDGEIMSKRERRLVRSDFASAQAIRRIRLRVDASSAGTLAATSALEKVSVVLDFDGQTRLSLPLGAFFGTGPWELSPFATRVLSVGEDGSLENRMPMPFRRSFELRLVNRGDRPVRIVDSAVELSPYVWNEGRSMHLSADYVRRRGVPSARDGKDYDLFFDEVRGKGLLAGTMVFINNTSTSTGLKWWGEGDEKIWVDGEAFPSVFGTGSEDYFNYAYSRPEPFAWPFCAQPTGAGNLAPGRSVNFRWRALDALPFVRSMTFAMEMWHWDKKCLVDYDSVSWRYLVPPPSAGMIEPLRPGERIAFFGDSITHGGRYEYDLQLFECLRHPGSGVRMINCGRSGGSAGEVRDRFETDVLAANPDRVFVLFGMNDVGRGDYADVDPDAETRARRQRSLDGYAAALAEIADRTKAAGKRLVLMTPSPYDQYGTEKTPCAAACNEPGLAACADIVRRLAGERGAGLIDLHRPLTEILRRYPDRNLCGKDRVHPGREGHLLMAAIAWETMGYAGPFAETRVRADGPCAAFRYAPKALPLPRTDAYERDDEVYPLTERINREIFSVEGLPSGEYVLKADGETIGWFSSEELAKGVNIALLETPSQRRAREVAKLADELKELGNAGRDVRAMDYLARQRGADPSDLVAATNALCAWIADLKRRGSSSAGYWSKLVDGYVNGGKAGEAENLRRQDEIVRRMFETARPSAFELSVEPVKGGSLADRVYAWGYVLDRTPTACPFLTGKTDWSLERAADLLGARKIIYMNSMFNRAYIEKWFPDWDRECFTNCIDGKLSEAHLSRFSGKDEVWCALEHNGRDTSADRIARLSLTHPNIVGINLDDFNIGSEATLMSPEELKALRRRIHAINPKLRIMVVSYAHPPFAFDLTPFRGLIDVVSRWCWVPRHDYWDNYRTDLAKLRAQIGPEPRIVQGIYLADFGSSKAGPLPAPTDIFEKSVRRIRCAILDGTLDGLIVPQAAWFGKLPEQVDIIRRHGF